MIDTFFDRTYNEEFNKIPLAFRFSSGTKKIFLGLIAIWVVIDIFLGSINANNYGLTKVMDGRGLAIRTDFSSWAVFIIANCILVLILTWAVIGTAFERIAFKRASKLDRLHKDWESERLAKQVMRIKQGGWDYEEEHKLRYEVPTQCKACTCPKCGLPLTSGETLCELCRAEME